jgi:hypothetical protein
MERAEGVPKIRPRFAIAGPDDMRAFHAEENAIRRDEIAAREAQILEMTSLVEVAFLIR